MADDKELEAFFAAARADVAVPDAALLDRIAAEGRALQPAPRPQVGQPRARARRGAATADFAVWAGSAAGRFWAGS